MARQKRPLAASSKVGHTYQRSRFNHVIRWVAFIFVLTLDLTLFGQGINQFLTRPGMYTLPFILKAGVGYLLVIFCNLMVVPSMVFEADKVEVTPERLIIHNLLFRAKIKWEEIKSFISPAYLKFAIIRTPRFFYLINKRDLQGYEELAQTIRHKADNLPE